MVGHGGDALSGLVIGFAFPLVLFLGLYWFLWLLAGQRLLVVQARWFRHGGGAVVVFGFSS